MLKIRRMLATAGFLAAVPLLMAGCTRGQKEPPACPQPAIVSGAQSASFGNVGVIPEVSDPSQVVYRATILGFGGGCGQNSDGTLMRLTVDLSAVAGPAYDGRPITFPYFVAVANESGQIIDKQVFTARINPPRGHEAVGVQDMIEQTLAGVGKATAPLWKVYIGIDMPQAAALQRFNAR